MMRLTREFPEDIGNKLATIPLELLREKLHDVTDPLAEEELTPEEDAAFDEEIAAAITYSLKHDDPKDSQTWAEFSAELEKEGV